MRAKQDVITGTALFMFVVASLVTAISLAYFILKG